MMLYPARGVGVSPITTCPHCSKLINGSCEVCADGDTHPSCQMCRGGQLVVPWYKHELTVAIFTTVVVSVVSALILMQIQQAWGPKKRR